MERILTYRVTESDVAHASFGMCPVSRLLKHRLHLTESEISRAKFLENGITADGRSIRTGDSLAPGQVLCVCLERTRKEDCTLEPFSFPLHISYEDEDLIMMEKPAGMVTHPSHGHYRDSAANAVAAYFYGKNQWILPRVAGRLDRDTSGLLVFAKNRAAAARLARQRREGIFVRTYLALAEGTLPSFGIIDMPLGPVVLHSSSSLGGKSAVTRYRTLDCRTLAEGSVSLLEVTIATGRTHQIRVHLSSLDHPLLGDPLYHGDPDASCFSSHFKRAALHAHTVVCRQPFTGKPIRVTAGLPHDFSSFLLQYGLSIPEK